MDGPRDLICIFKMTRTKLQEAKSAQSFTLPQSNCCHLLLEISTKIRWLSLRFLSGALVTRTQHTYFGLHPAPFMITYWMETTLKISIPGVFYRCGWQLQHAESTLSSFPVSRWPDGQTMERVDLKTCFLLAMFFAVTTWHTCPRVLEYLHHKVGCYHDNETYHDNRNGVILWRVMIHIESWAK